MDPGGQREAWLSGCVCTWGRPVRRALPQTPSQQEQMCSVHGRPSTCPGQMPAGCTPGLPRARGIPVKSAVSPDGRLGSAPLSSPCPSHTSPCAPRAPSLGAEAGFLGSRLLILQMGNVKHREDGNYRTRDHMAREREEREHKTVLRDSNIRGLCSSMNPFRKSEEPSNL